MRKWAEIRIYGFYNTISAPLGRDSLPRPRFRRANNNNTLLNKARISDNTFARARDDARDDIAQGIHDEANPVLAQLADYGVTAARLTALQTRIDAYRMVIASPKMAIRERSTHTGLLKQEFSRADMIVKNRLDGLVRQFEDSNATFVANYQNARKIFDTGSQPKPPAPPPTP